MSCRKRGRVISSGNLITDDKDSLELYKRQAIHAAGDFHYGDSVIEQISNAKTDDEISKIMQNARHKTFG